MEDSLIINYIKKKNEKGMEMLIDIYGGLITTIVRKHLFNLQNVQEECIDDILLAIWNNIDSFNKDKNSFKNWIGAISKYNAINYKKKYIKGLIHEDIDIYSFEASDNVENDLLKNELKAEVKSLLNNLKDDDKEIFIKHYLEERDIYSISKEMNMKASVVYNRLSRGRKKLRSKTETLI
ncbi:sigma-70 family RNA polymerase sigma factor [Candidatus Clostridium stratigraminis]|uniref:Sigma-70 family RNA polymerase sigma factor n=1 Tax=Candidatus Clostridium stratigraminis TaxID=3381661 RepID=A0ABW8T1Q2_9CLOT